MINTTHALPTRQAAGGGPAGKPASRPAGPKGDSVHLSDEAREPERDHGKLAESLAAGIKAAMEGSKGHCRWDKPTRKSNSPRKAVPSPTMGEGPGGLRSPRLPSPPRTSGGPIMRLNGASGLKPGGSASGLTPGGSASGLKPGGIAKPGGFSMPTRPGGATPAGSALPGAAPSRMQPYGATPGRQAPAPSHASGQLGSLNPNLDRWDDQVLAAGERWGVPPERIKAMMAIESGGDPGAYQVNPQHGDTAGLMQINQAIWGDEARRLGYDLNTPDGQIGMAGYLLKLGHDTTGTWDGATSWYFNPSGQGDSVNGTTNQQYIDQTNRYIAQMGG